MIYYGERDKNKVNPNKLLIENIPVPNEFDLIEILNRVFSAEFSPNGSLNPDGTIKKKNNFGGLPAPWGIPIIIPVI
ncbi:hypothetical protein [Paenibacillus illinoisensis]|nr:hypothetical protein [Paenibacillus illinoisensis]